MNNEEKFRSKLNGLLDEQHFPYDEANWEQASQVLDKDDRRKKRFFFILFTGAGISLALLLVYLLYPSQSKQLSKTGQQDAKTTQPRPAVSGTRVSAYGNRDGMRNANTVNIKSGTSSNPANPSSEIIQKSEPLSAKSSPDLNGSAGTSQPATITKATLVKSTSITRPTLNQPLGGNLIEDSDSLNTSTRNGENPENLALNGKNSENNYQSGQTDKTQTIGNIANVATTATLSQNENGKEYNSQPIAVVENSANVMKEIPLSTAAIAAQDSALKNLSLVRSPDSTEKAIPQPASQNIPKTGYFYVESGTFFNAGWNYAGTREGMGFNPTVGTSYLSKINERISLSIGAYYCQLAYLKLGTKSPYTSKNQFGLQADPASSNPSYPGEGITLMYGEQKNIKSITPQSLHYLMAPAKLHYLIGQVHCVTFGYSLLYLIEVRSKVSNYTEGISSLNKANTYKTWGYTQGFKTLSSQLGMGYRRRIYKNLWANGELQLGLSDLRDNAFFNIEHVERAMGITISFTYNLLKK